MLPFSRIALLFLFGLFPSFTGAEITFYTEVIELSEGETISTPFHFEKADKKAQAASKSPHVAKILQVLRDEKSNSLGFIQVLGLKRGQSIITLGKERIGVLVHPKKENQSNLQLRIVSPVEGARLWGRFQVGVEIHAPQGRNEELRNSVQVRLGKQTQIANRIWQKQNPPDFNYSYSFDSFELSLGKNLLVAFCKTKEGNVYSSTREVYIHKPSEEKIFKGECEDSLPKSPPEKGARIFSGFHPKASGKRFVICKSAQPPWKTPLSINSPGFYQLMLRGQGNQVAGAYPSVGLYLNENRIPETVGRLVQRSWHRVALGKPFFLPTGEHTLKLGFINDLFIPHLGDRNLFLDSYELAPISTLEKKASSSEDNSEAMMMSMMAMMEDKNSGGILEVTFERLWHNFQVNGTLEVGVICRFPKKIPHKPLVHLLVNGKSVAQGEGEKIKFSLPPVWLRPGKNEIQAQAVLQDFQVATPSQFIYLDENWWRGEEVISAPHLDQIPPQVILNYPPEEHKACDLSLVVAKVFDNHKIHRGELIVDGKPFGVQMVPSASSGRLIAPLILRQLSPGGHTLSVKVFDAIGNVGESREIVFFVDPSLAKEKNPYYRAVALTNRLAFGPEKDVLADILLEGEMTWLKKQLASPLNNPAEIALRKMTEFHYSQTSLHNVQNRALYQTLFSSYPVQGRFLLWIENHFSTWIRKSGAKAKWREHIKFYEKGPSSFQELLWISATSPAMLIYLDQNRSFIDSINENYARELMELHTLGIEGGYTQEDVTQLAHLLTGWTVAEVADAETGEWPIDYSFTFVPRLNSGKDLQFLGFPFPAVALEKRSQRIRLALDILASHPKTIEHLCKKFLQHYVSNPVPEALLKKTMSAFIKNGGKFSELFFFLIEQPEFWEHALKSDRITSPLDFSVRMSRNLVRRPTWSVYKCLQDSGFGLFDCATPDGYPENDAAYANSNIMLQKWKFIDRFQHSLLHLIPWPWRLPPPVRVEAWRQNIIDLVAVQLSGKLLSEKSNKIANDFIQKLKLNKHNEIWQAVNFIAKLPEINLR